MKSRILVVLLFSFLLFNPHVLLGSSFLNISPEGQFLSSALLVLLGFVLLALGVFLVRFFKFKKPGFLLITPYKRWRFFSIDQSITNLEPVIKHFSKNTQNITHAARVLLSERYASYFLEDKNFKGSILINRRRRRRYTMNHGTILDAKNLNLIFINPAQRGLKFGLKTTNSNAHKGTLLSTCPVLQPSDKKLSTFYLSKNINYIGSSSNCDLFINAKHISSMHAQITRIAGKYKLINLVKSQGIYVNGRKVEEYFLKPNDDINFENIHYKFIVN